MKPSFLQLTSSKTQLTFPPLATLCNSCYHSLTNPRRLMKRPKGNITGADTVSFELLAPNDRLNNHSRDATNQQNVRKP